MHVYHTIMRITHTCMHLCAQVFHMIGVLIQLQQQLYIKLLVSIHNGIHMKSEGLLYAFGVCVVESRSV